jgi:hypothetical protein
MFEDAAGAFVHGRMGGWDGERLSRLFFISPDKYETVRQKGKNDRKDTIYQL